MILSFSSTHNSHVFEMGFTGVDILAACCYCLRNHHGCEEICPSMHVHCETKLTVALGKLGIRDPSLSV